MRKLTTAVSLLLVLAACKAPEAVAPRKLSQTVQGPDEDWSVRDFPAHDLRFDNTVIMFMWKIREDCEGATPTTPRHICKEVMAKVSDVGTKMRRDKDRTTVLQSMQKEATDAFTASKVPYAPIDLRTKYQNIDAYNKKIADDRVKIADNQKLLDAELAKPQAEQDAAKIKAWQKAIADANKDITRQQAGIDKTTTIINTMLTQLTILSFTQAEGQVETLAAQSAQLNATLAAKNQALADEQAKPNPDPAVIAALQNDIGVLKAQIAAADKQRADYQANITAHLAYLSSGDSAKYTSDRDGYRARIAAADQVLADPQSTAEAKDAASKDRATAKDSLASLYLKATATANPTLDMTKSWEDWKAHTEERDVVDKRSKAETDEILSLVDHYAHLDDIAIDVKFDEAGKITLVKIQNWDPDHYQIDGADPKDNQVIDENGNHADYVSDLVFSTDNGVIRETNYEVHGGELRFAVYWGKYIYNFKVAANRYTATDKLYHFQGEILRYVADPVTGLRNYSIEPKLGTAVFDDRVQ